MRLSGEYVVLTPSGVDLAFWSNKAQKWKTIDRPLTTKTGGKLRDDVEVVKVYGTMGELIAVKEAAEKVVELYVDCTPTLEWTENYEEAIEELKKSLK